MYEIKRDRSALRLRIFDDDKTITLSTSGLGRRLISDFNPNLCENSPRGWQDTKYEDTYNLWLPCRCFDYEEIEELFNWATQANNHIWLRLNKNIQPYFSGDEMDFCIANDWNYDFEKKRRTVAGEAEYQLKYNSRKLDIVSRGQYSNVLAEGVLDSVRCLPFSVSDYIVTAIPAVEDKQRKLSWGLARFVARELNLSFCPITLVNDKPAMKSLPLEEKIRTWRDIYADPKSLIIKDSFRNRNVLIVDDLYQSGASVWCFAEFLKERIGVKNVIAVTAVKSMRDDDNK